MVNIPLFSLLLLLISCSGIKMIVKDSRDGLYRDDFAQKIDHIKRLYQGGQTQKALEELGALVPGLPAEEALRENLIGVVHFSKSDFPLARTHFERASGISHRDNHLRAQVGLNLASAHYKLNNLKKAYESLAKEGGKALRGEEYRTYYKFRYLLAKELSEDKDATHALFQYFRNENTVTNLKADPLFSSLSERFRALRDGDKMDLLDEFSDLRPPPLVTGLLGHQEAERLYYGGAGDEAQDLLGWLQMRYGENKDVAEIVGNFISRIKNYGVIQARTIGVVLPLSGPRSLFGKRALTGIDSALKSINGRLPEGKRFSLVVKDSQASGVVGAHRVRELVEGHFVSVIIGGLFPNEATEEYFEARRLGTFYLGLSQVYAPKEQKDHLLLEIPGSIESQVNELFSPAVLNEFGRRAAIVYPQGEHGEAYLKEFWRRAKLQELEVTGVVSFRQQETDYREPVKKILGLSFHREREEEYKLFNEIHSLEKKGTIRRVQTLRPQVDFDWVFIPAFPKETLQIVPTFSYFDAFNVNIIGIPSWRTQTIVRENRKLGSLYFIGDTMETSQEDYRRNFIRDYKRRPRVVELRSHDAMVIAADLVGHGEYDTRDKLDLHIRGKKELSALTGKWVFSDGVWIKEMNTLKISRGKIDTLF